MPMRQCESLMFFLALMQWLSRVVVLGCFRYLPWGPSPGMLITSSDTAGHQLAGARHTAPALSLRSGRCWCLEPSGLAALALCSPMPFEPSR